ncbi:hypothetical protein BGZ76_010055 [Entomortierella beljakovae]|nr:hypothetical protein BGZ76_010055 [Entomortierella beljakovae]
MSDIQAKNNEHFDKTAQDYDNFPKIHEMTQRATQAILEEFTASTSEEHVKNASVLDFGCGTGLCTFKLAPSVKHILGVDASQGMLNHLNHKLSTNPENAEIRNKIETAHHLVSFDSPLPEPALSKYLSGENPGFDMVYSTFAMHHIEDVQGIVDAISHKLLKKDGWVIIVDFDRGHDHGHGEHGHNHGEHGHNHGEHGHSHGEHGHNHGEHGHSHGEHGRNHGHHCQKAEEKNKGLFVDESGKELEYVAHTDGFSTDKTANILKKAGLVDVSAKTGYSMEIALHGKEVLAHITVAKGRRP